MSKLWVFGDSYAELSPDQIHWSELLSNQLDCNDMEVHSHHGAANEWIYFQFVEQLPKISSDDFVVIVSTQINRRWFFMNDVGTSNFKLHKSTDNNLSPSENLALEYYTNHLDNTLLASILFETFCNAIHYVAEKNNINLLILPGFEERDFPLSGKYNIHGSLFDICKNEVKGNSWDAWWEYIAITHQGKDPRCGHLSLVNHEILSDKLFNTFTRGELLELESDFKREIV
jgi:hypothetical protein